MTASCWPSGASLEPGATEKFTRENAGAHPCPRQSDSVGERTFEHPSFGLEPEGEHVFALKSGSGAATAGASACFLCAHGSRPERAGVDLQAFRDAHEPEDAGSQAGALGLLHVQHGLSDHRDIVHQDTAPGG